MQVFFNLIGVFLHPHPSQAILSQRAEPLNRGANLRGWFAFALQVAGMAWERLLWPFYSLYELYLEAQSHAWRVPRHIGIIMDGNRRFARRQGFGDIIAGHRKGAEKLEDVLRWCEETGIPAITVWIFSLDNFNRDTAEVDGLFDLFEKKFLELVTHPRIHRNQVRVCTLGEIGSLPPSLQKAIKEVEAATCHYTNRVLNIGVAYGGREEIVEAFRKYLRDQARQGKSVEEISNEVGPRAIEPYLYTSHVPDPELIIRTSGEIRLSGFLLWQSVYSEFYFCDTNWPAFRRIDFLRALRDFHHRQRRFGR